jgi:protein PhnA
MNHCELCQSTETLSQYQVPPKPSKENELTLCSTCLSQIQDPASIDVNHWRCLNESMWSEREPVQVMSYRMLATLKAESWARDLLEQMYLDDSLKEYALSGVPSEEDANSDAPTLDSNGTPLAEGDSITLIKDLDVKGAGFTAKRGTLVKNIKLTNNPKHIEGRVNGIQIVLVAAYLKKS